MSEPDRVATIEHIETHVEQSLELLPGQFRKVVIEALVRAFARQVQKIEDVLWYLASITIANAEGVWLDELAALVGVSRGALDDTDLRGLVSSAVLANRSDGTLTALHAVLGSLSLGAYTVTEDVASFYIDVATPPALSPELLASVLRRTRAAGIGGQLVYVPPGGDIFTFSTSSFVAEADASLGFADDGVPGSGGQFAGVIELCSVPTSTCASPRMPSRAASWSPLDR